MTEEKTYYAIAFSERDDIGVVYDDVYSSTHYSYCKRFDKVDCYEDEELANIVLNKNQEIHNKYVQEYNRTPRTYFLIKVKKIFDTIVVGYERIEDSEQ